MVGLKGMIQEGPAVVPPATVPTEKPTLGVLRRVVVDFGDRLDDVFYAEQRPFPN